jgi:hypothetical protein
VKTSGEAGFRWQWILVLLVLASGLFAFLEPEGAEASRSTVTVAAMVGVGWFVWHLMSYD